jgi:hypothetical protein
MKYLVESGLDELYITDNSNNICFACGDCGDDGWLVGSWNDDDYEAEADVVWDNIKDELDLPEDFMDFILNVNDLNDYIKEIKDNSGDIIEELNRIGVSEAAIGIIEGRLNKLEDNIRDQAARYGLIPFNGKLLMAQISISDRDYKGIRGYE